MLMKVRFGLLIALILLPAFSAISQEITAFSGKVVGISDGDTITVLDNKKQQHRIRIAGIDAPESGQAFGQKAKNYLSDLVFEKIVTVIGKKTDRYGRLVAQVFVEGRDVGYSMTWAGFAWHYKEYENEQSKQDRKLYDEAEKFARFAKANIWSEPKPVPPWEFRKGEPVDPSGPIIGTRNSKIYHWPGCPDYHKVTERNKVPFKSREEAEAAGYRAAKNCKRG